MFDVCLDYKNVPKFTGELFVLNAGLFCSYYVIILKTL